MNPGDFHFELPSDLIAQLPLPERAASRLLHVPQVSEPCDDLKFTDLSDLLEPGDLLVLNDTRVVPARLFGRKSTGARVEVLLERELTPDCALVQLRANRSPADGTRLNLEGGFEAQVDRRQGEFFVLRFSAPLMDILESNGHIPLPPYIKRSDTPEDGERYQTVFAQRPGAVAAPTAGLHFDHAQLNRLRARGVEVGYLTLHIGAGTFQPLRAAEIEAQRLHKEYLEVPDKLCEQVDATQARDCRVVAVGTTSVRGLETAALSGELRPFAGDTDLFVVPGFKFKVVDALLTNFHLPESSLLMLVCAFAGTSRVLNAYQHAVSEGYRFYSYGDAMFCHGQMSSDRA